MNKKEIEEKYREMYEHLCKAQELAMRIDMTWLIEEIKRIRIEADLNHYSN